MCVSPIAERQRRTSTSSAALVVLAAHRQFEIEEPARHVADHPIGVVGSEYHLHDVTDCPLKQRIAARGHKPDVATSLGRRGHASDCRHQLQTGDPFEIGVERCDRAP